MELCIASDYFVNNKKWGEKVELELNQLLQLNSLYTPVFPFHGINEMQEELKAEEALYLPMHERVELCLANSVLSISGVPIYGRVYLTNNRLCFMPNAIIESVNRSDRSSPMPSSSVSSPNVGTSFSRGRATTFTNSSMVGSSPMITVQNLNFNLAHVIIIPLGFINSVARKEDVKTLRTPAHVVTICCSDFRIIKIFLPVVEHSESIITSFFKRISFHVRNPDCVPAFEFLEDTEIVDDGWNIFNMQSEMKRLDISGKFRIVDNNKFELCSSYPSYFYVPSIITDDELVKIADFRSSRRIPAVCWHNRAKRNVMVRSSQPLVGLSNNFCELDEKMIAEYRLASCAVDSYSSSSNTPFYIFDARSNTAANGNKIAGKGTENTLRYEHCKLRYMEIENIHTMRASYDALNKLVNSTSVSESSWLFELQQTGWMEHIKTILNAAVVIASCMDKGCSVLIHCSDGWDRTSQLTSLSQLLLDPYYRSLRGFAVLVEKEWMAFGHRFRSRNQWVGNERSPVFIQWLDWY